MRVNPFDWAVCSFSLFSGMDGWVSIDAFIFNSDEEEESPLFVTPQNECTHVGSVCGSLIMSRTHLHSGCQNLMWILLQQTACECGLISRVWCCSLGKQITEDPGRRKMRTGSRLSSVTEPSELLCLIRYTEGSKSKS